MQPKRILVVDDEQHILDVVVYVLEENAFQPIVALNGETALRLFQDKRPHLVILDLMLPRMSGLDVFREMRRLRPDIPVIMLTSRSDEMDRVLGLELGADDYISKPFSTRELAARVRTVLRRADRPPAEQSHEPLRHGPIQIEPENFSVRCFGRPLALTRAEFLLLETLVRHPARVFTRDALINHIYNGEHVVTDRSVDASVKRLRAKFAELHPGFDPIQTVHGLGYKLSPHSETTR